MVLQPGNYTMPLLQRNTANFLKVWQKRNTNNPLCFLRIIILASFNERRARCVSFDVTAETCSSGKVPTLKGAIPSLSRRFSLKSLWEQLNKKLVSNGANGIVSSSSDQPVSPVYGCSGAA